eukprot:scaffold14958_cov79-Phaeocystis_antarctica.AAC.5
MRDRAHVYTVRLRHAASPPLPPHLLAPRAPFAFAPPSTHPQLRRARPGAGVHRWRGGGHLRQADLHGAPRSWRATRERPHLRPVHGGALYLGQPTHRAPHRPRRPPPPAAARLGRHGRHHGHLRRDGRAAARSNAPLGRARPRHLCLP